MIISTEAIVLHSRKYSDTSAILTLYTREQGKIGVVVKGSRRPKSKFGSAVMPLNIVDVSYYYKLGRDLHTLSSADSVVSLRRISDSYDHLSLALALTEAVLVTQPPAEKNAALYELLRATLIVLNDAQDNVYSFFAFFCIHLAEIMGFMIDFSLDIESDAEEAKVNSDEVYFSFDDGAPLRGSVPPAAHSYRLRRATMARLHELASMSILEVSRVHLSEEQQREVQNFFVNYFSHHLERRVTFRAERIVLGE